MKNKLLCSFQLADVINIYINNTWYQTYPAGKLLCLTFKLLNAEVSGIFSGILVSSLSPISFNLEI